MEWNHLHTAYIVARTGSLLRAGRELGIAHTTVGRHVDALERSLGVTLFQRSPQGLVLTADGERLIAELGLVEGHVAALQRRTTLTGSANAGKVRVTAGETFACTYLAPRLAKLCAEYAELEVELVASGKILDLARREADIAVRTFKSKHQSLIIKKVGSMSYGLYGQREYVHSRARAWPAALGGLRILTSDAGTDASWAASLAPKGALLRCDLSMGLLHACTEGHGIAVLPRYMGDAHAALVRIRTPPSPVDPLWLTVHRDARRAPRIRLVLDYLSECMMQDADLLCPA